ncbi:hypothetical protein DPMN_002606 [Dreissena polymorpha]|uniref:Uncharacterized protein n=1 Tax=Dreissena polymorpha TaxID=45954 RepID=A0A9D4MLP1_DREPO|nr:hypothetical protein DPMN_002606 [Dreissena polymorpha]
MLVEEKGLARKKTIWRPIEDCEDLKDRGPEPLLWLSHYTFQERNWRERDRELTNMEDVRDHRGCGPREWTRGGGTQCAQRTGETVSGLKTTADDESGHKGRAACCTPSAELPRDISVTLDTFEWSPCQRFPFQLVHVSGLLLIVACTTLTDCDPNTPSQPKSTQVNPSRPKSTQVNPSKPESTQVDPSQPK